MRERNNSGLRGPESLSFNRREAVKRITDNQLLHRQYLGSPIWKQKRIEALNFYGAVCSRCGRHGTDVHHKTYDRVGGGELMEDLEIMCRGCHEAHHRVERLTSGKTRKRHSGINRQALATYLTSMQKQILCSKFGVSCGGLYSAILFGDALVVAAALKMVGKKYAYLKLPSTKRSPSFEKKRSPGNR